MSATRAQLNREQQAAARRESLGRGPAPPTLKVADLSAAAPAEDTGVLREKEARWIPISRIDPDPNQPRTVFEGLEDLAVSLRERGQIQACRVIATAGDRHQLVCGERRWRAATIAGLPRLLCLVVQDNQIEIEREADQLIENMVRADLSPAESSRKIKHQLEVRGCSQRQLSELLGISQSAIAEAVAFDALAVEVKEAVQREEISASTAREIGKLPDRDQQVAVTKKAIIEHLTRDDVREEVKSRRGLATAPVAKERTPGQASSLQAGKAGESSGPVVAIGGQSAGENPLATPSTNPWKAGVRVHHLGTPHYGTVEEDWEPEDGRVTVLMDFADGQLIGYFEPDELKVVPAGWVEPVPTDKRFTTSQSKTAKEVPAKVSWGCDLPGGGNVSVMLPKGGRVLLSLYEAIEEYKRQQEAPPKEKPKNPKH